MYIHVHIYIYIYMCIYMHVYIHIYIYIHVYTYVMIAFDWFFDRRLPCEGGQRNINLTGCWLIGWLCEMSLNVIECQSLFANTWFYECAPKGRPSEDVVSQSHGPVGWNSLHRGRGSENLHPDMVLLWSLNYTAECWLVLSFTSSVSFSILFKPTFFLECGMAVL